MSADKDKNRKSKRAVKEVCESDMTFGFPELSFVLQLDKPGFARLLNCT